MQKENAKLSSQDREFYRLVEKATFGNPFSLECEQTLQELTGFTGITGRKLREISVPFVLGKINTLDLKGKANLRFYDDKDKKLVRVALLYDAFHRFHLKFDALIKEQIDQGDDPIALPFADDLLALLEERGFTHKETLRYLAFFYQLRRAFYFINQTMVGESQSMRKLRCNLWNNIFTQDPRWYENFLWDKMEDFSTFLIGETGTGKGTAAAALGRSGFIPYIEKNKRFAESFTKNFIEINLSQFPETLIESELFGHKKGSFTGAVEDHKGVFSRCNKYGAILLDEIGDISVAVQLKLLKVLEERRYTVVGGHSTLRFNGRIIAATNKSIDNLRKEGKFRDDFYYRLCSDIIYVPSLREQIKEDPNALTILLNHTVRRIIGEPADELAVELESILSREVGSAYEWPGNVRELEQAVRRLLLTRHYNVSIYETAIPLENNQFLQNIENGKLSVHEMISLYCDKLYRKFGTYEEVAKITKLDRRTVKKYIIAAERNPLLS